MPAPPVYLDECVDYALAEALRQRGFPFSPCETKGLPVTPILSNSPTQQSAAGYSSRTTVVILGAYTQTTNVINGRTVAFPAAKPLGFAHTTCGDDARLVAVTT